MFDKAERIGVIGLGNMGGAIGTNLCKNGFQVIGYDLLEANRENLLEAGGRAANSVGEVAEQSRYILLSLPSAAALQVVVSQLLPKAQIGTIVLECSTLSLQDKIRVNSSLTGTNITMLDIPLSGTGAQAKNGDLSVYISGDEQASNDVVPIIEGFSRSHYYLGRFGNGMKMKYVANLLVTIHNESSAEAILFGTRFGLPAQLVYDVISDSAGMSRIFQIRGPMMVHKNWQPATMTNELYKKDLNMIKEALDELGVCAPLFTATLPIYQHAIENGHAEDDTAAVYSVLEEMSQPADPIGG
ncbi:MAG TPA: NAD(P)-dependent oxidoreductase [Anaerovoracaceae bacterium]|nr:NAD(P)-dependent oxidoreductase [Anaerovoracaceae bacterium]